MVSPSLVGLALLKLFTTEDTEDTEALLKALKLSE
jgi:hypothetical protein